MLVTLAVAISLVVLLRWPTDGIVDALGKRSQQVFRVFGYVLLTSVMFLVPAFPATSIVRERNRGTLHRSCSIHHCHRGRYSGARSVDRYSSLRYYSSARCPPQVPVTRWAVSIL